MKSWNNLYEEICSFENLWRAACAAERGKRFDNVVGRFRNTREAEVCDLRAELMAKTWRPGAYRTWMISRPKARMISAAPFRANVTAARRRLRWQVRRYRSGRMAREALETRWHSWRGHALQADGFALVNSVRQELRRELERDAASSGADAANRSVFRVPFGLRAAPAMGANGNQVIACGGAARGTTTHPTCAARIATTTTRTTRTTT
jgi:hypothetical protein